MCETFCRVALVNKQMAYLVFPLNGEKDERLSGNAMIQAEVQQR